MKFETEVNPSDEAGVLVGQEVVSLMYMTLLIS